MPGTKDRGDASTSRPAQENSTVPPMVAVDEDEDVDTLRARLAETESKVKEYESRMGRQVQVSGDRIKGLEDQLRSLSSRLEDADRRAQQASLQAQWDRMTPTQQAQARQQLTEAQVQSLQDELASLRAQKEDQPRIDALVKEARDEGYDVSLLDTSSLQAAIVTFERAEKAFLRAKVKELASGKAAQEEAQVEDAIRAVTGRKVAGSGAPASSTPVSAKVPDDILELDRRYQALKPKARISKAVAQEMLALKIQASRRGYTLS